MKSAFLLAGLIAFVAAAPASSSIATDARVEILRRREIDANIRPDSVSSDIPTDISSILGAANTADYPPLPPGIVVLYPEHDFKAPDQYQVFYMLNQCQNFGSMSKKSKSLFQGKGTVCAFWDHNDCETGGGALTSLHNIHAEYEEQAITSLEKYDGRFASGRCFKPVDWNRIWKAEALVTRGESPVTTAAASSITLCSEHNKQGECKTFTMGSSGTCIRFDGMYMRAKSLLQPQGSACLYWSHDDCEEGGGPATALIDIYSFDGDQNWSTLFPYKGLFASGKCYGSDQSLKARGSTVGKDV